MRELEAPNDVHSDPEALEVLRVWIVRNQQQVSLRFGVWEDPAAWGIFLVDLARHLANAYQQDQGLDFNETVARIKWGFDAEMNSPTDSPRGTIRGN